MERANREMEKRGEKREGVPAVILLVLWMKYRLAVSGLLPRLLLSAFFFFCFFILFLVRFNYSPSCSFFSNAFWTSLKTETFHDVHSRIGFVRIQYFSYFSGQVMVHLVAKTYHYHTLPTGPSITFNRRRCSGSSK